MSERYSAFALLLQGFAGHQGWPQAWRKRRALGSDQVRERLPLMTQSVESRYLPNGGVWQRRGGIARHGAVARQSDKGEIVLGGGLDRIPSYGQRGSPPMQELIFSRLLDMFPAFGQLKLMRQWGRIVDVVPDSSPIIGPAPVPGLLLNCGWGTGGFKAIPTGGTLLAHLLATGAPGDQPPLRPLTLSPPGALSTRRQAPASRINRVRLGLNR